MSTVSRGIERAVERQSNAPDVDEDTGVFLLSQPIRRNSRGLSKLHARLPDNFDMTGHRSTRAPFPARPGLSLFLGFSLLVWVFASFDRWAAGERSLAMHWLAVSPAFYFLCVCAHDGTHYVLHRNRRLNYVFSYLFSMSIGLPFALLRAAHWAHHRHLHSDLDPERVIYESSVWALPLRLLLVPIYYLGSFRTLSRAEKLGTLAHFAFSGAVVAVGGLPFVVAWCVPALMAIAWFGFTAVYVPHSRHAPFLMRLMHAHSGYHLDHHADVRYPITQYVQLRAWNLTRAGVKDREARVLSLLARAVW